jgi:glycosyltransferase involved in cell wall biosynthesis
VEDIYFSIVIPLYNKEKSIQSTIQSVLDQSYPNFELIVVNDGSKDQSMKVVETFSDKRIRIINQTNKGASKTRNIGIKSAKYKYIVSLDADDIFLPGALEEFVYLITNFPLGTVFATTGQTDRKSIPSGAKRYYVNDYYYSSAILMAKYNIGLMMTGVVAISKECFEIYGFYNENIVHGEDIDLWNRLQERCKIVKSEVVTMVYRMNAENRLSNWDERDKIFSSERLLNKNEIQNKSRLLFIGCQLFVYLYSGYKPKDISWWEYYGPYKWWILRAAWLYLSVRVLKREL